jgi:death-on-curing protein
LTNLTLEEVIKINRYIIRNYGGRDFQEPDNLQNPNTLIWTLNFIQDSVVYGIDQYPTIGQKAALLAWNINTGHVFYDGNKRTSTIASTIFLEVNGFYLNTTDNEIIRIALAVANKNSTQITFIDFCEWYLQRVCPYS